jgi:hypothetical protein
VRFPLPNIQIPPSFFIKRSAHFCYNLHRIEQRIKQVFIYREDDYWLWQIVDVAGRELFADTVYYTRDEAVTGATDALKFVITSLNGNKN